MPSPLKVIDHHLGTIGFQHLLNKFDVKGMNLIGVLGCLVGESEVERHLVGLVHDGPLTRNHSPSMKPESARDRFQIPVHAGEQFIRSTRLFRLGPENDNVREHNVNQ